MRISLQLVVCAVDSLLGGGGVVFALGLGRTAAESRRRRSDSTSNGRAIAHVTMMNGRRHAVVLLQVQLQDKAFYKGVILYEINESNQKRSFHLPKILSI